MDPFSAESLDDQRTLLWADPITELPAQSQHRQGIQLLVLRLLVLSYACIAPPVGVEHRGR
jgi:hypothetical protein